MSLINLNFESKYLGNSHEVSIIMPDRSRNINAKDFYGSGKKYRVLWLLHGTFGDHSDWVRFSNIELYAREKNLIVVMPSALNSDYVNWDKFGTGYNMGDYLTEELMPLVHNWLPASDKKEDNFIAGLSMGGQGALQYILNHPDKFAAGAILSAPPRNAEECDWEGVDTNDHWGMCSLRFRNNVANAGGKDTYINSIENTWKAVLDMYDAGKLPKLMFAIGDKDSSYNQYLRFKKLAEEKNMGIHFFELPNLAHEWRFWDPAIQEALKFFEINEQGSTNF